MGGSVLAVLCVGLVAALLLCLALAAVFLRAAVSLANLCLGAPSDTQACDDDGDDAGEDSDLTSGAPDGTVTGVPMPGLGRAALVALVTGVATAALATVIGFSLRAIATAKVGAARADDGFALVMFQLITLPLAFLLAAAIRSGMLLTSFERAALVALFEYLMGIVAAVGIVAIVIGATGGLPVPKR